MPENTKDNDTRPTRSTEPDLDFRTRLTAFHETFPNTNGQTGRCTSSQKERRRPLVTNSSGHWQDARPQALGARYAFVAEMLTEMESRSLAFWDGSDFGDGFTYRFPGTPCQRVAAGHICA